MRNNKLPQHAIGTFPNGAEFRQKEGSLLRRL